MKTAKKQPEPIKTFLEDNHRFEWLASEVHPDITYANVVSLSGNNAYERLLYGLDDSERINTGRLREKWLKRYEHLDHGGWWCSGVDLLTLQPSEWGCFKPQRPKVFKGKAIKYETPPNVPTGIFALNVQGGALRNFPIPQDKPFWEWVIEENRIPITITEGAKKAGCLLSTGHAAIGLSGIWNFTDEDGNLKEEIKVLCRPGREFVIAYDQDNRWHVRDNINRAARRLAEALQNEDCIVTILRWEFEDGKGIDDFIVKEGSGELSKLYEERLDFEEFWEKYSKPREMKKSEFLKFLQTTMKGRVEMNAMSGRVEIDGKPIELSGELCYWFLEEFNIDAYETTIVQGLLYEAKKNKYHPVKRYLDSIANLKPAANIDNLAVEHFGADDPFYNVLVKKWLIGAVARVYEPGCQFDNALILQGDAYAGKSTWFATLGGEWFDDSFGTNIESTKQLMVLHDCWIQEWSEFNNVASKQDFSVLKSFLSRKNDKFVRPYGREASQNARSSVMGGSINPEFFLQDETGDRKFWVVPVKRGWKIPIDKIRADRDRIWAAAVQAYRANPNERYTTREEHEYHQKLNERFRDQDAWFDMIRGYLLDKDIKRFSIDRILLECLEFTKDRIDQKARNRVRRSLVSMGCIPLNNSRVETEYDGKARRLWDTPENLAGEILENNGSNGKTTVENNGSNGKTTVNICTPLLPEIVTGKELQDANNGNNGRKEKNFSPTPNGNGKGGSQGSTTVENNGSNGKTTVENNGSNGKTTVNICTPLLPEIVTGKELQDANNGNNGKKEKNFSPTPNGKKSDPDPDEETYESGLINAIADLFDKLGWDEDRCDHFLFDRYGESHLEYLSRSDLMDAADFLYKKEDQMNEQSLE